MTVYATTLTGLATRIKVSQCSQEVTFSSDFGYSLEKPSLIMNSSALITPAPAIKTTITYYMASWQALTSDGPPSNIDSKICTVHSDGRLDCAYYHKVWYIQIITVTSTSMSHVDLTTTVSGPGTLIVEAIHMDITITISSISLPTSMVPETGFEVETTSKSTRPSPAGFTQPSVYMTRTVELASNM